MNKRTEIVRMEYLKENYQPHPTLCKECDFKCDEVEMLNSLKKKPKDL